MCATTRLACGWELILLAGAGAGVAGVAGFMPDMLTTGWLSLAF
jgi:hypothetical protein